MKNTHIPAVMRTGCFSHYHFVKILDIDDSDGPTYAVQYFIENKTQYDKYIDTHAAALRQDATMLWGQLMIGFRSLMEVVN
jgi:hypothetical protein